MKHWILLLVLIFSSTFLKAQEADSLLYDEGDEEASEIYEEDESTNAGEGVHQSMAPEELEGTAEYQSRKVDVRKFDQEKWKKIVGSVDYNEKKIPEKPEEKTTPRERFSIAPWGGAALRLIAYIVIAGVVILLLYIVFKNTSLDLKLKKTKVSREDFETPVENIEEIDIQSLLEQARTEGNLRLVVRLYYLGLLKKLNAAGMIVWKKDKTNRDYLNELFNGDHYFDEVMRLTLSYEQVWYGERTLTEESFQKIVNGFETIHQKINRPEEQ